MTKRKNLDLIVLVATIVVSVGAVAGVLIWRQSSIESGADPQIAQIGGPFTLVDEDGRTVTDRSYAGKWLLVFFGFTYCPDVCPTALAEIGIALDQLGALSQRVQPLFISVDPERDTPQVLKDYTKGFHPRMIGLTGTPDQVAEAAKNYRVFYRKSAQADSYTMDHTGVVYLLTPEGKYASHFTHPAQADRMVAKLRELLK